MPYSAQGFAEALAEAKGGDAPPDAIYDADLVEAKTVTTRDGRDMILLTWRVLSGPHRDAQWDSWHTLERFKPDGERNPGFGFTVSMLRDMEFPVDDPAASASLGAINTSLEPLKNNGYSVEVKRNGTFVNTYVKGVLATFAPSLPGSGGDTPAYGQQRQPANAIMGHDGGGTSAPPQSLTQAATQRNDVERTGASDVTSADDVAAFDRSNAPKQGDVDPETGEEIPF